MSTLKREFQKAKEFKQTQKNKPREEPSLEEIAISWARRSYDLVDLENMRKAFEVNSREMKRHKLSRQWLLALRRGLNLSFAGMAEKLQLTRQAIHQMEIREFQGDVSLKNMRKFADAIDCDFVYGFTPKKHPSFTQMIAEKVLPFVRPQDQKLANKNTAEQKAVALGQRIELFLREPTGWWKVWRFQKATSRDHYSWIKHLGRR